MEVLEEPLLVNTAAKTDYLRLYEHAFPLCARWVKSMNGSLTDAEDIFQDAMIIFLEKRNSHSFHITTTAEAYILGIAKHLWIRKFHKSKSTISLSDVEQSISLPDDFYPSVNTSRLLTFLEHAGRHCLELLTAFYYDTLSTKELAAKMGYRSEHTATVQKYKCMEKLRTSIQQKSLSYEDFTE